MPEILPHPASEEPLQGYSAAALLLWLFGAAHLAKAMVWALTDLLLGALLHRYTALDGMTIGDVLGLLLLVGAACDYLIGLATDRWLRCAADLRACLVVGGIATGVCLMMQFAVAPSRMALLIASGIAFRVAFAMIDVPLNAMTSLLPASESDLQQFVRVKMVMAAIARLAVAGAHLWFAFNPTLLGLWVVAVLAGSVIVATCALALAVPTAPTGTRPRAAPGTLRRNGPPIPIAGFLYLLLAFCLATCALPTLSRLLVFAPHTTGVDSGALLLFLFCIGSIAGPLLPMKLSLPFRGVMLSTVALGISLAAGQPEAAAVFAVLHGVVLGRVGAYLWLIAAEVARDSTSATGRRDGYVAGIVTAVCQLSIAAGIVLLGPLVDRAAAHHADAWVAAAGFSGLAGLLLPLALQSKKMRGNSIEVSSSSTSDAIAIDSGKGWRFDAGI